MLNFANLSIYLYYFNIIHIRSCCYLFIIVCICLSTDWALDEIWCWCGRSICAHFASTPSLSLKWCCWWWCSVIRRIFYLFSLSIRYTLYEGESRCYTTSIILFIIYTKLFVCNFCRQETTTPCLFRICTFRQIFHWWLIFRVYNKEKDTRLLDNSDYTRLLFLFRFVLSTS